MNHGIDNKIRDIKNKSTVSVHCSVQCTHDNAEDSARKTTIGCPKVILYVQEVVTRFI